jgi:hypothetical protein
MPDEVEEALLFDGQERLQRPTDETGRLPKRSARLQTDLTADLRIRLEAGESHSRQNLQFLGI